ncbi:hypothetical protein Hanom_Chr08g00693241 [Helianthus anomalus]
MLVYSSLTLMPFTNNKKSNLDLSNALVKRSARWSSVWTLTTSISLFSKQSRMKWYLISMCLVFECCTGFLVICNAAELST